jgi:hypothetical protein
MFEKPFRIVYGEKIVLQTREFVSEQTWIVSILYRT